MYRPRRQCISLSKASVGRAYMRVSVWLQRRKRWGTRTTVVRDLGRGLPVDHGGVGIRGWASREGRKRASSARGAACTQGKVEVEVKRAGRGWRAGMKRGAPVLYERRANE